MRFSELIALRLYGRGMTVPSAISDACFVSSFARRFALKKKSGFLKGFQILELICIGSSKKPISNGPLFSLLLSCFDARVSAGFTDADCRQGKSLAPFQTSTGSRGRALRLRLLRRKQRPCGRGWWPGGCLRSSVSSYTKARALAQCFSLVCTRGILLIETLRTMIC